MVGYFQFTDDSTPSKRFYCRKCSLHSYSFSDWRGASSLFSRLRLRGFIAGQNKQTFHSSHKCQPCSSHLTCLGGSSVQLDRGFFYYFGTDEILHVQQCPTGYCCTQGQCPVTRMRKHNKDLCAKGTWCFKHLSLCFFFSVIRP